eukprot:2101446-Prymnesium_polylepis.1
MYGARLHWVRGANRPASLHVTLAAIEHGARRRQVGARHDREQAQRARGAFVPEDQERALLGLVELSLQCSHERVVVQHTLDHAKLRACRPELRAEGL